VVTGLVVHGFMGRGADPVQSAAIQTRTLLKLSQKLNQSASADAGATAQYLANLRAMKHSCELIGRYHDQAVQASAPGAKHIADTVKLCGDLTKLIDYSYTINAAVLPLMHSSTTAHRFETVWPLAGIIHGQHQADVQSALNGLSKPIPGATGFSSSAKTQLTQLQSAINHSRGLGYFPALEHFQAMLAGERQTYWLNYAHLGSMDKALSGQLSAYCRALSDTPPCN